MSRWELNKQVVCWTFVTLKGNFVKGSHFPKTGESPPQNLLIFLIRLQITKNGTFTKAPSYVRVEIHECFQNSAANVKTKIPNSAHARRPISGFSCPEDIFTLNLPPNKLFLNVVLSMQLLTCSCLCPQTMAVSRWTLRRLASTARTLRTGRPPSTALVRTSSRNGEWQRKVEKLYLVTLQSILTQN